jgi:hypothetical protein
MIKDAIEVSDPKMVVVDMLFSGMVMITVRSPRTGRLLTG